MTAYPIPNPFSQWNDVTGLPLSSGYIWIGEPSQNPETHPIAVYQDAGLSVPYAQPLRTTGGFLVGAGTPVNAYPSSTPYSISVRNKANVEVYYQAVVHDELAEFLATLNDPSTIGLIGYNVTNTYPAGSVGERLQSFVTVTDAPFNAKCDGTTDDTTAIQAAIDAGYGVIFLPGPCVASGLVVNRRVDTQTSYLRFVGTGDNAGFKMTAPGTLFTSTLTGIPTGSPQSEKIAFENIQFEAVNASDACYIMSKNFLRIRFDNCIFRKIKVGLFVKGGDTSAYAQQYTFNGGHATGWQGDFLKSFQGYAVNTCGAFQMEAGGNGIVFDGGVFDVGSVQCMYEGCTGTFWTIAGGYSATFIGNYTEGNGGPDYIFADVANGGRTQGVVFEANHINPSTANAANVAYSSVVIGLSDMTGSGNTCLGGTLYDDTVTPRGQITSTGDVVAGTNARLNKSGIPITVHANAVSTGSFGLAFAGTNAATATPIVGEFARFNSGTGGGLLPACSFGDLIGTVTVINDTPAHNIIYANGTDTINGGASIIIPEGARFVFSGTGGVWRMYNGPLPYQPQSTAATVADVKADLNLLLASLKNNGYMPSTP